MTLKRLSRSADLDSEDAQYQRQLTTLGVSI